jgi:hypothetical protein
MERARERGSYHREDAARKAATVLRLFVEMDQDRE